MRLVILLLALHVSASATDSYDVRRAADDPQVLAVMQDIALRGAHQFDQQEVAAFLVRDANGLISSVMWPHTANRRSEHYDGAVPAGTVAIAHTHPIFAERPSHGDIEQAKRIGLPIYVITRWNLYVVDATGTVMPLIEKKDWARSTSRRKAEWRQGNDSFSRSNFRRAFSVKRGNTDVMIQSLDDNSTERVLQSSSTIEMVSWSADGQGIVVCVQRNDTGWDIRLPSHPRSQADPAPERHSRH